jgi:hypothetical protein
MTEIILSFFLASWLFSFLAIFASFLDWKNFLKENFWAVALVVFFVRRIQRTRVMSFLLNIHTVHRFFSTVTAAYTWHKIRRAY